MGSFIVIGFIVVFIAYAIVFGKKKEYEYEAKLFNGQQNHPVGEFEVKKFEKEDPVGELTLYGSKSWQDGTVSIAINNSTLVRLEISGGGKQVSLAHDYVSQNGKSKAERKGGSYYFPLPSSFRAKNNDEVQVEVPGSPQLTGVLIWD